MRNFINIVEKQVGRLYHFTDMQSAWGILDEGKLKIGDKGGSFVAMGGMFISTAPRTHISMTRNPRLVASPGAGGDSHYWGSVRIVLDGDKLAHRNKIEPYLDRANSITRQDDQAEERIKKEEVNITGCVISVDFNFTEYMRKETDFSNWCSLPDPEDQRRYTQQSREDAAMFVREMRKRGYRVNLVRKF